MYNQLLIMRRLGKIKLFHFLTIFIFSVIYFANNVKFVYFAALPFLFIYSYIVQYSSTFTVYLMY